MKRNLILVAVVVSAWQAFGQGGFVTTIPDRPVGFSQVTDSGAWVQGHWVPVDPTDVKSKLPGPSISEISCDRSGKVCYEKQANIQVMGDTFAMNADYVEYTVERWNGKEIVASNIQGACRARNVIKFDRVNKKIYWMQTLSEPVNDLPEPSKDMCKYADMNLELKDSTMWKK